MSPKTGRPPKENPRKVSLNIRLTEMEAKDSGMVLLIYDLSAIMKGIELLKAEIKK